MRVAALYDIHGNLPALEAVLGEVEADLVVVGGDVAPGPMVGEVLDRLSALEVPVRWVMGNGDREVVEARGGEAAPDALAPEQLTAWTAERLSAAHHELLGSFEPTVEAEADGLGSVLFCHGSPRSDTEIITAVTPPERLAPMLERVEADVVVCGHTHHQFDRTVAGKRVVNAGSVGMPYQGEAAAFWLTLGPGVELRRTSYDVGAAVERLRATGMPEIDELMLRESLLEPVSAEWVADYFEQIATKPPGEQ
jgi:putative phosphoesterase